MTSVVLAGPLAAQQSGFGAGGRCNTGPGAAFGITGYQCANCGFKSESGERQQYTFFAEPVVTSVLAAPSENGIQVGDVIEAVDGSPIITQAGADAFTYPTSGGHKVTIRRGRDRREIYYRIGNWCGNVGTTTRGDDGIHTGSGSGFGSSSQSASSTRSGQGMGRGVGVSMIGGDPLVIVDGIEQKASGPPATGKFGFAVECNPSCARMRTTGGLTYYKYEGFPRIIEVRDRSAAGRAGLRVGDLIVKVDGRSILDDDAGLAATEDRDQLRITVRRDGKDIDVLLLVSRSE